MGEEENTSQELRSALVSLCLLLSHIHLFNAANWDYFDISL